MVEVIKVIDFTDVFVRMKEILYIKVFNCSAADKVELFQIAETFKAKVIDYGKDSLLLELCPDGDKNDAVVKLMKEEFRQDRSRARRKRRYRVDQCDGAVKERTFLRERKEYYHNYVKKINKKKCISTSMSTARRRSSRLCRIRRWGFDAQRNARAYLH